ncbi:MAG: hypothetical protein V3V35_07720 [Dehalococcoidia bacterium]
MRIAVALPADATPQDRALWWGSGVLIFSVALLIGLNSFYVLPAWNMAREGNVATFFHSAILAALGLTLVLIGSLVAWGRRPQVRVGHAYVWLASGVLFGYFAIDEAIEVHERVAMAVWKSIGIWDRILHYEISYAVWEALFAPIFIVGGLLLLVLMVAHRRYSPSFFWMGLAALAFWGMALMLEFVGLTYLHSFRTSYGVAVFYEESFELLGSTVLLLASVLMLRGLLGWGDREGRPPIVE